MALQVRPDGSLLVRAPQSVREPAIQAFIRKNGEWIERTARLMRQRAERIPQKHLEATEVLAHKKKALADLSERCLHFSERLNVRYKDVRLSNAQGRWGSCSASGRLRFNWRLAMVPAEIMDYVVVHELAHLKELNHSPRFWAAVEQVFPEYRAGKKWLKENAALLHV